MQLTATVIFLIATLFSASKACRTRTGAYGDCVNIKTCRPVMDLLKTRPPMRVYNELRRDHCGFDGDDPKICCETWVNNEKFVPTGPSISVNPISTPRPTSIENHPKLHLLNHDICGPVAAESKIFGGSSTRIFEFPWMALLAYDDGHANGQPDFRCGGTIVNQHYVMTAAHCVTNLPESLKLIGVRVGEHDLGKERDCELYDDGAAYLCAEKHQDFRIKKIYVHPNYSTSNLQNDIALIRINGTMNFKPASVRPICLPLDPTNRVPVKSGLITGWGSTEDGTSTSEILRKVKVPVLSNEVCIRAYRDQPFVRIGQRQICAGGAKGKDSCSGDSGGPLQSIGKYRGEFRTVQNGIVSFGRRNCGVQGSPGVYTNVAYYVHWILDTIEE